MLKLALFVLVVAALGCGASAVVECRLAAVQQLPLQDPDLVSVGDVRRLVKELKACEPEDGDAGAR